MTPHNADHLQSAGIRKGTGDEGSGVFHRTDISLWIVHPIVLADTWNKWAQWGPWLKALEANPGHPSLPLTGSSSSRNPNVHFLSPVHMWAPLVGPKLPMERRKRLRRSARLSSTVTLQAGSLPKANYGVFLQFCQLVFWWPQTQKCPCRTKKRNISTVQRKCVNTKSNRCSYFEASHRWNLKQCANTTLHKRQRNFCCSSGTKETKENQPRNRSACGWWRAKAHQLTGQVCTAQPRESLNPFCLR